MNRPFFTQLPRSAYRKRSAREVVLAQWRGCDCVPLEIARKASSKKAGDVLPSVLKTLRIETRQSEAEILKVWDHLIDPTITAHARPTGVVRGTLFVSIDSSVWLDEIVRYRRKEILERLQNSFGRELISRISFRVG